MVKKPVQRRSGKPKSPVTIDLEADAVKRNTQTDADTAGKTASRSTVPSAGEKPLPAGESKKTESAAKPEMSSSKDAMESKSDSATPAKEVTGKREEAAASVKPDPKPDTQPKPSATTGERKPTPVAEPDRSKGKGGSALAGGIIGSLLTLGVAGGAWYAGLLPEKTGTTTSTEQQNGEIAALREELKSVRAVAEKASQPASGNDDASAAALESLNSKISELQAGLKTTGDELAVLKSTSGGAGNEDAAKALSDRLGGIETKLSALENATDNGETGAGTSAAMIEEKITPLATGLEEVRQEISQIGSMATNTEKAVTETQAALSGMQDRLTGVEDKITELGNKVEESGGQGEVARAIAATALKTAIDRGQPFMSELETFATVSGDGTAVESLRSMAATGVPTRAALSEEAKDAAFAMIDSVETLPEGAGLLDRLSASARSLVKSRPVGTPEGEAPADITARLVTAVESGDYAKALAEYETLPEKAKSAGSEFASRLKARLEADRLVEDVLSSSLTAAAPKG